MLKNIKKWITNNPKPVAIGCLVLIAAVTAYISTKLVSLPTTQSGTSVTFRWRADEALAINVTQIGSEPISGMVSFSSTSPVSYDAWRQDVIAPPIYGDPIGNLKEGVAFQVPEVDIPASTYLMRSGWADVTLSSKSNNITTALTPTGNLLAEKTEVAQTFTILVFLLLSILVIIFPSPKKRKVQGQKSSLPPTVAPTVSSIRYDPHGRKTRRETQALDETSPLN